MKWTGLSKSVNAEETKGYHASAGRMMTNLPDALAKPLPGPIRRRPPLAAGRPVARRVPSRRVAVAGAWQ
ncbi:hypothetical protein EQV97_13255 [Pseudomonas sp. TMW22090]|nr:hypothetical protein [Pseudomonas sp. TMW22090]